jgi:hypothetical protein
MAWTDDAERPSQVTPRPIAVIAALAATWGLSACQGYGYAYDYDPYLGPRGHYVSPFDKAPRQSCQRTAYAGPYEDGYRGAYRAGPICVDGVAVGAGATGGED